MSWLLSPEAESDALVVWDYINTESGVRRADGVLRDLQRGFGEIASAPGAGFFLASVAGDHIRFFRVHSYLIAYRWKARPILILRILHAARDLPGLLADHPDRPRE